ncbi:hypothetical protein PRK78_007463 [Emydomyces testavorans]|uniref:Hypercellular protein HypA n=1 Tax=Emydomyces testavorans TaxID=2070801 RepID=A0AAF0ILP6_9EURO|nr:hypothetical protein PRK78_007463 [Emydomyces testavorans]
MAVDPISPIAPARLRTLLLPIGRIKRSRFFELSSRLQAQNVVRLGDVSPIGRPNRMPPTSHLDLFPFELFREPLAILAIADGKELLESRGTDEALPERSANGIKDPPNPHPPGLKDLVAALNELRESYPRSLIRQLLIFDYEGVKSLINGPDDVTWIPSPAASRTTTMKTLMCDISSLMLKELANFAESLQEWPSIDSPKASSWGPRRTTDTRPADKLKHRMTMPAQLPSQPNAPPNHHSDTELTTQPFQSPTTFDEITRSIQLANRTTAALKSGSNPGSKEHSRERMSVQGLASINELSKTRFQARLKVVVGLLHLQAGIWPEAMKELVEGATGARTGSDYIWHAKALEGILPRLTKPPDTSDKSTPKVLPISGHLELGANSESRVLCLQALANLLPDISNHILNLYTRATNITDEPLPQLVFSQTTIRLASLLATAYIRDGLLDDNGLKRIVMNCPLEPVRLSDRPRGYMVLRKTEIASFVFRALPLSPAAEIPITDSVQIFAGITAVLTVLGFERKRGFVLKELLMISITGLVQARKIGAAEMGIHPAAGLSALNNEAFDLNALDIGCGNTENSMRDVLAFVASIYGAPSAMGHSDGSNPNTTENQLVHDSVDAITERANNGSYLASYGDISLKVDILKACIDFSEALPDFQGVLQFTAELLYTIKGSIMLSSDNNNVPPILPPEEQVRLYNNIKRTVGAARRLGRPDMEAEYWDDFMLRSVEVLGTADVKQPVQRSKKDYGMSTISEERGKKSPFIYSAFSKAAAGRSESVVIAGEQYAVKVVLQNPYEFDVEVESLRLEGSGVSFEGETHGLWLRPFSLEEKAVSLLATTEGTLKITGCIAKVKFCRQRRFPIFNKSWKPEFKHKLKRTGLAAKKLPSERPLSWGSIQSENGRTPVRTGPEPHHLLVNVIKSQPIVEIESSSLSQNAIMVLEGQTSTFDITLRNLSSCPVDLIFFTFQDSTAKRLQTAISNKDNLPSDVHELEYQLSENPALRLSRLSRPLSGNEQIRISPGDASTFTVEVFGKPGLNDAEVYIDYGYTGTSCSKIPETFYTRQLSFPITVTVNASVELRHCDILPFNHDFSWLNRQRRNTANSNEERTATSTFDASGRAPGAKQSFTATLSRIGIEPYGFDHCLLLLDVRNSWQNPLCASILVVRPSAESTTPLNTESVGYEVTDSLQPGHTTRLVVVAPRIFLDNPHKAIPSLGHANKRQFVVSARKVSYETEASRREAFWFREELLKLLRGTWKDEVTGHEGTISLRGITLSSEAVNVLRLDDIEITFSISPLHDEQNESAGVDDPGYKAAIQTGYSKFTISTNSFLTLRVTIFNRSSRPVHPLLRLIPSLRHQPPAIALELTRRLSWTGMLQRALPILGPGQTTEALLGLTALCRGEYEIGALVEEVRRLDLRSSSLRPGTGDDVDKNANLHDATKESTDDHDIFFEGFEQKERRIWHARVPCLLSARD